MEYCTLSFVDQVAKCLCKQVALCMVFMAFTINSTKSVNDNPDDSHLYVCSLTIECRITHVISIFSASQLHFLANRNAELAGGSQ